MLSMLMSIDNKLYQFKFRMTVIIYFVLHVPSLKSLAEPMGSLLARPLSGSLT